MKYKNCGFITKTFYNISINPGEVKDFPGFVNSTNIIRVFEMKKKKIKKVEIKQVEMKAEKVEKHEDEKPSPVSAKKKAGRPSKSSKPNINLVDDNISEDVKPEDNHSEKEKN